MLDPSGLRREIPIEEATIELMRAAGALKSIKRSGWIKKAGIKEAESVADHSYRVALLAMLIGLELPIDSAKLIRMCLLHDLAESSIGDKMPEEKESEKSHRRQEDRIVKQLLLGLPKNSRKILLSDWEDLIESNSREAKLTWEVDKVEMVLQQRDYVRAGYDRRKLHEFEEGLRFSPALQELINRYSHS
jgi:5'-deoxynucleotidase